MIRRPFTLTLTFTRHIPKPLYSNRRPSQPASYSSSSSTAHKSSDPLHILFCGSDHFSCHSLQALHDAHHQQQQQQQDSPLIQSINVVVRPSKPTGRGLKKLREVPLKTLATTLNLPIHERDTFTGWNMPPTTNLIIAVSFGLFVPPRLLSQAKYGGLNVHPSLLPDLRGPAPLHHALLNAYPTTGITIQTLSPHTFDTGTILSQTPPPGIPIPREATYQTLHDTLAPIGARMLLDVLRKNLHVPPHEHAGWWALDNTGEMSGRLRHAPKITSADRQVLWSQVGIMGGGAEQVARRGRVLGPLWSHVVVPSRVKTAVEGRSKDDASREFEVRIQKGKRVLLDEISVVDTSKEGDAEAQKAQGRGAMGYLHWIEMDAETKRENDIRTKMMKSGKAVLIPMADGSLLRIGKVTIDGQRPRDAAEALRDFVTQD